MKWANRIVKLSNVAQAAFAALAKSVQLEWSYLQCILPNFDEEYTGIIIQEAMNGKFWPAVFAGTLTLQEKLLFSLPARMGGMRN